MSNNLFVAPQALQPPLLLCPDQSIDSRYLPIITFEATSANGSSNSLPPDARHNNKNLRPKEIPQHQYDHPNKTGAARAAIFRRDRPAPINTASTQQT
jgi:hypothetical protein